MAVLRDIADEVGVSISLVSRVLNNRMGSTGVRPALAERIRAAAADMNYQPNPAAVALSGGRKNVLGVFVHRLGIEGSGIIERTIEGISAAAQVGNQRLVTSFFTTADDFENLRPMMCREVIDGMLVIGIRHPELVSELLSLRETGLPVATFHDEPIHDDIPNVGLDRVAVGRSATAHLISRGSRKIVCIQNTEAHRTGYLSALRKHNLPEDPRLIYEVATQDKQPDVNPYGTEVGKQLVRDLIAQGITFDAIVAESDAQAIGAMNELPLHGLEVPTQVRVIGVDDSPHCVLSRVPLSSVSGLMRERARLALELLIQLVQEKPANSIILQPQIRARESTA